MVKEFNECTIQSNKQIDTIIDSEEHVDARTWLRNNSAKHVDAISDSEKLVVDVSDPKSDPSVATHTTKGISTQKLFINPTIQAVVRPITLLVTVEVEVTQESLSPRQTSLPQANITDAARSCARIFRTTGKVIGTERDRAMPRDASSSETRLSASCKIPTFVVTSVYPTRIGNQDIFSPRHPSITIRGRNAEPFNAFINGFSAVNEHYISYFGGISGAETVSAEVSDVNPRENMNFESNSVFGKTPKSVDLGISPAHTADKLKTVFVPATRTGGLTDNSDGFASRHCIA